MTLHGRVVLAALVLSIVNNHTTRGQHKPEDPATWIFLPGNTLLSPLTANQQEPRVGLRKEIETSRMKLDIGSTLDVVEWNLSEDGSNKLRLGIDFFTYALTTSSTGLRLQVDAVDGFFGGHVVYRSQFVSSALIARLRLLHLSSHFLDGHFDQATNRWKDDREPIPFTKDFGELVFAYEYQPKAFTLMLYSGLGYSTLIRPTEINRIATLHGVELRTDRLYRVFGRPFWIYVADNLSLTGVPHYSTTNNAEIGVKFGDWNGPGVKLYLSYYSGLDVFSQYYNVRRKSWGLGFSFDFW
jgi:hypothetical protein